MLHLSIVAAGCDLLQLLADAGHLLLARRHFVLLGLTRKDKIKKIMHECAERMLTFNATRIENQVFNKINCLHHMLSV